MKYIIDLSVVLAAGLVLAAIVTISTGINPVGAVAPNMHARVATTTQEAVGPQQVNQIVDERALCASRVVNTFGAPVMLSFHPDEDPSATQGHYQAASTSIAYDAEQYGCGAVEVYGFSSSTITVTEFGF